MTPLDEPPASSFHRRVKGLNVGLLIVVALSGCMSSRYKMAPKNTPAPVIMDLKSQADAPAVATMYGVIVYQGPGSWKKSAYWDEYVISIENHGSVPVTLESASLVGLENVPREPGTDPWVLEKSSRTALAHNFGLAANAVVQLGGGLATVIGGGAIGSIIAPTGWLFPAGLGPGLLAGIPVAIGGTIYRNVSGRHKIEAEFTKRRVALPTEIAPAQTIQGSLFFQITPGPRELALDVRSGDERQRLVIELTPLRGLHLRQKTPVPDSDPATSAEKAAEK